MIRHYFKEVYNSIWIWYIIRFFLFSLILSLILIFCIYYFKFDCLAFLKKSWSNVMTLFSILSWFLLAWIPIILSTTKLSDEWKDRINRLFNTTLREKGLNADRWISKMKEILLIEVVFQFFIIIFLVAFLCIFLVIEEKWSMFYILSYVAIFFASVSIVGIIRLLNRLLIIVRLTEFNV